MSLVTKQQNGVVYLMGALVINNINHALSEIDFPVTGQSWVVNGDEVSECDSTGVALFVHWLQRAKAQQTTLILQNMSETVLQVIELYSLLSFFTLENQHESR